MAVGRRRWLRTLDWGLVAMTFLLVAFGIVLIYSATHDKSSPHLQTMYVRQLWWLLVGFVAMVGALVVDYRIIARYAYVLYGLCLASLIYLLFSVPWWRGPRGGSSWGRSAVSPRSS